MANQFLNFAKDTLQFTKKPLTFNEVWELGLKKGVDKKLSTKGKTPWSSLGAQLFVDVRDNPDSEFVKVGSRPARFYLKSREKELTKEVISELEEEEEKVVPEKGKYTERQLHSVLTYYAYSNLEFN